MRAVLDGHPLLFRARRRLIVHTQKIPVLGMRSRRGLLCRCDDKRRLMHVRTDTGA